MYPVTLSSLPDPHIFRLQNGIFDLFGVAIGYSYSEPRILWNTKKYSSKLNIYQPSTKHLFINAMYKPFSLENLHVPPSTAVSSLTRSPSTRVLTRCLVTATCQSLLCQAWWRGTKNQSRSSTSIYIYINTYMVYTYTYIYIYTYKYTYIYICVMV